MVLDKEQTMRINSETEEKLNKKITEWKVWSERDAPHWHVYTTAWGLILLDTHCVSATTDHFFMFTWTDSPTDSR